MGHSVDSRRTDPGLSFLLRKCARFHDVADDALVALHGQLNMAAQVVARFSLPRDNSLNMGVLSPNRQICRAQHMAEGF